MEGESRLQMEERLKSEAKTAIYDNEPHKAVKFIASIDAMHDQSRVKTTMQYNSVFYALDFMEKYAHKKFDHTIDSFYSTTAMLILKTWFDKATQLHPIKLARKIIYLFARLNMFTLNQLKDVRMREQYPDIFLLLARMHDPDHYKHNRDVDVLLNDDNKRRLVIYFNLWYSESGDVWRSLTSYFTSTLNAYARPHLVVECLNAPKGISGGTRKAYQKKLQTLAEQHRAISRIFGADGEGIAELASCITTTVTET